MDKMILKLDAIYKRYNTLSERLSAPEVISDTAEWTKIAKEQAEIAEPAQKYEEYLNTEKAISDCEAAEKIETDREMKELLSEEILSNREKLSALREELKILLLPKDKNDDRNCIMEIRDRKSVV